jgi:hypothetical protein
MPGYLITSLKAAAFPYSVHVNHVRKEVVKAHPGFERPRLHDLKGYGNADWYTQQFTPLDKAAAQHAAWLRRCRDRRNWWCLYVGGADGRRGHRKLRLLGRVYYQRAVQYDGH